MEEAQLLATDSMVHSNAQKQGEVAEGTAHYLIQGSKEASSAQVKVRVSHVFMKGLEVTVVLVEHLLHFITVSQEQMLLTWIRFTAIVLFRDITG
jgi:ketosteroid isomerase-like protein